MPSNIQIRWICGWMAVFALFAGALTLAALPAWAHEGEESDHCADCHSCDKPTKDDPCLKKCERPKVEDADTQFKESQSSPDVLVIDKMSDVYGPVLFPHRLHASMEAMSDGCRLCHHHETEDKPQPCEACHVNAGESGNLWQPSLRGAYHRQCLSCHRDWSGEADCVTCHAERTPGQAAAPQPDVSDVTGRLHPNVEEPDKRLYRTPAFEEGTLVTFNHKEHVQMFGKRCVDCHAQENCNRCHSQNGEGKKHVREDPHQDCVKCHDVEKSCDSCHTKTESLGFDHLKRSGFEMKAYHKGVTCRSCHKDPKSYAGLKRQCNGCHAPDWAPKAFDHAKSEVLVLDEKHVDVGCADCHPAGMGAPVKCDGCHDNTIVYPQKLPGTFTEKRLEAIGKSQS